MKLFYSIMIGINSDKKQPWDTFRPVPDLYQGMNHSYKEKKNASEKHLLVLVLVGFFCSEIESLKRLFVYEFHRMHHGFWHMKIWDWVVSGQKVGRTVHLFTIQRKFEVFINKLTLQPKLMLGEKMYHHQLFVQT